MRGGRARWQRATEMCNPLKKQGANVAPNDGQGAQTLSVRFVPLLLLAFVVDQTPQMGGALCQALGAKCGRQRL